MKNNTIAIRRLIEELWYNPKYHLIVILLYFCFWWAELLFFLIVKIRLFLYQEKIFSQTQPSVPVISVGNITAGGSGKTPITIFLAEKLIQQGMKVMILSRGYNSESIDQIKIVSDGNGALLSPSQAGDEPCLIATKCPKAVVIVSGKRKAALQFGVNQYKPDIVLLDDGFQHLSLYRDIDIAVINCENPYGNQLLHPIGPLREPLFHLDRANILWHHANSSDDLIPNDNKHDEERLFSEKKHIKSKLILSKVRNIFDNRSISFEDLKSERMVLFTGIAKPERVYQLCRYHQFNIAETHYFEDHHVYTKDSIELLFELGKKSKATFFITTEKDAVKLNEFKELSHRVGVLIVDVQICEGVSVLNQIFNIQTQT